MSPAPTAAVTDEMVRAANRTFWSDEADSLDDPMRSALEAAFAAAAVRPDDVQALRERAERAEAERKLAIEIANDILAGRTAAEAQVAELKGKLDEVQRRTNSFAMFARFACRMCYREDPPHAAHKLTDGERLNAIKYHPTMATLAGATDVPVHDDPIAEAERRGAEAMRERAAKVASTVYSRMFPRPRNRITAENAGFLAASDIRALSTTPEDRPIGAPARDEGGC